MENLIGKTYNYLKVVDKTEYRNSCGAILYKCECLLCGNHTLASSTNLKSGVKKSCGCLWKASLKKHVDKLIEDADISGQTFNYLRVKKRVGSKNKQSLYLCECILCKSRTVLPGASIKSGNTKSCGCLKKDATIKANATDKFDGTSVGQISKKTLSSSNTSGYTGVSLQKATGRWRAHIKFKGKSYHLGLFDNAEDAAQARKAAENKMFGKFLECFNKEHSKK